MAGTWQDRIIELRHVRPSELRANPANWRTHPEGQRAALGELLSTVGVVQPLLLNLRTAGAGWPEGEEPTLVDGHLRQDLAAAGQPDEAVPVIVVDLTPDEERMVLATLDPLGAMADADGERVAQLLDRLGQHGDGVAALLDRVRDQAGVFQVEPTTPPALTKDRGAHQIMTFTLHDEQAEEVKAALAEAKERGLGSDDRNKNGNGNALAAICRDWLVLPHGPEEV